MIVGALTRPRQAIPIIQELEGLAAHWESEKNLAAAGACRYAWMSLATFYHIAEDMGDGR